MLLGPKFGKITHDLRFIGIGNIIKEYFLLQSTTSKTTHQRAIEPWYISSDGEKLLNQGYKQNPCWT